MEHIFHDISKYYAANIMGNVLTVGKIVYKDGMYSFARDDIQGPFNLVEPDADVTRMVHVIGEVHPRAAIEKLITVEINSCLYLNENEDTGEIEVRSIHKGMGTAIYSKQECPLILWNPKYEEHLYFDVIDIQNVFAEERLKNSFTAILAESLREFELFPPLLQMKRETGN
ncbi:MAG: hypothetical protein OEN02_00530 [Gammaproteobacteria bacterium]|nr:hypothetical protein [Gammaproteobacteria bacterium]MDH3536537.1 hypothetical protein [Gammaproteobacteria bacterium]